MLTNHPAERPSSNRSFVRNGTAMILSALTFTSAYAGNVLNLSCVGGGMSNVSCVALWGTAGDPNVRQVPQALEPISDADHEREAAADRKWRARCHPHVEADAYGVPRYHYSAPGCEFGVGAN